MEATMRRPWITSAFTHWRRAIRWRKLPLHPKGILQEEAATAAPAAPEQLPHGQAEVQEPARHRAVIRIRPEIMWRLDARSPIQAIPCQ